MLAWETADSALIRQVKDDMRDWCLAWVIWVADRGFASAANPSLPAQGRRALHHRGEAPLRVRRSAGGAVPARAGISTPPGIAEDERFVICFNPEAAERDAAVRLQMIAQLTKLIKDSDALSRDKRAGLRRVIIAKPGLNRHLRVTPGGLLRTDAARAKAKENLDGKYLLRTSDRSSPQKTPRPTTSSSWKSNAAGATSSRSSTCARSTTQGRAHPRHVILWWLEVPAAVSVQASTRADTVDVEGTGPDGVWLVEPAALSAADAIPGTLASLLGLRRADRVMDPTTLRAAWLGVVRAARHA